jgi:hypothetical protein
MEAMDTVSLGLIAERLSSRAERGIFSADLEPFQSKIPRSARDDTHEPE